MTDDARVRAIVREEVGKLAWAFKDAGLPQAAHAVFVWLSTPSAPEPAAPAPAKSMREAVEGWWDDQRGYECREKMIAELEQRETVALDRLRAERDEARAEIDRLTAEQRAALAGSGTAVARAPSRTWLAELEQANARGIAVVEKDYPQKKIRDAIAERARELQQE